MIKAELNRQLMIQLKNTMGTLADVTAIISSSGINVIALCAYAIENTVAIMFVTEDNNEAKRLLEEKDIFNALCPRNPRALKERMEEDEIFVVCQKRRAQSEGRIAVLKNNFLGRPLRAKGFERRELAVSWAVLAHNLWVLARLPKRNVVEESPPGERQAA